MSNKITVGLDLGTDKCCITYQDNIGRPFIMTDNKNYKISSIIGILNNGLLVGNEISRDFIYDIPIISNLKRLIGHKSDDEYAIQIASYNGWTLEDADNDLIIKINHNQYNLSELVCVLLKKIKQIVISNIGDNFDMVITVPANFNEGQKNQILNFCKYVGIDCKRLIYEPCSASLAYINYFDQSYNIKSISKEDEDEDQSIMKRIMVFDFGAGTLDLAIVTCNCLIEEGTIEWLAKIELNIGDNNLGGIDIDMALEKYIKKRHPNLQQIIDSKNESIKFIIEKIKIQLSKLYDEHKMTSISIVEKYYNQLITVSIQDYFDLLDEHFKMRIIGLMDQLHNSNIKKTDIDTVLLIGGSCYNPWVKKLVSSYYEKQINEYKIKISDHFETYDINIKDIGVSLGATCVNRKKNNYGDTLILTESLPLSIGIDTVNNLMCKLLPKNTLIPCVAKKYFTTCEDNQQKIEVKLYQGECDDVRKNFFLGDFIIDKLDLEPQGKIVVIINVAVTTDGLITIEGKVKNTDKFDKKIIINRYNTNLDSKKIESNVKDYELNDSVFNSIMTKYYELVTMLNRLQFNLIDNISCKTDDTIIDDILKSFWDDLIIVYTLMTQSNKIKQNIQQLKKFINYISDTLHYESITHNLDLSDDKAIIVKLDKLNKYINKNLLHLVSSYQIKADGADKTQNNDYDTFDDDVKLKQVNSITNPTEILDSTERSLLYQNENDNSTSKDNLSYIKQIKDLVIMLVNEIESLVMPDTNKLLILEILDRHEIFLDTISRNESFNGKSQLELLQNTCMSISNINDQKLISELQNKLNDLSNESKTFERDYNNILECIINYKIVDNKTEEKRKKKNKKRIDRRKAKKVGAMRQD